MNTEKMEQFKAACKKYLSTLDFMQLRIYGRKVGVAQPTTKTIEVLIEEIILILTGQLAPIEQSTRGAPIKNNFLKPEIEETIEKLRAQYEEPVREQVKAYDFQAELRKLRANRNVLRVADPNADVTDVRERLSWEIFRGQIVTFNGVHSVLNLQRTAQIAVIPEDLYNANGLREGDIVTFHAREGERSVVATNILSVNDLVLVESTRKRFEECTACYPKEKILLYNESRKENVTAKYLQWLLPLGKGQRGCILSAPKAGKTQLLAEIAELATALNPRLFVCALLNAQSPEIITVFRRRIEEENLVYTTYDDEPEKQVFAAEFILNRAKRYAESGKDVLLLVDSFNELALAYNDTAESAGGRVLAGGLESKTLYYLKKYFSSARCLEEGGSLTMLATAAIDTGNPADDLIGSELARAANYEIRLSEQLAIKRIYPTISLYDSRVQRGGALTSEEEEALNGLLLARAPTEADEVALRQALAQSDDYQEFAEKIKKIW